MAVGASTWSRAALNVGLVSFGLFVVSVASIPYFLRLAWDPWLETWRLPGRTLLLALFQLSPVALLWLALISGLSTWKKRSHHSTAACTLSGTVILAFLLLDSANTVLTERHLLERGEARFLFLEGRLAASTFVTPWLAVAGTLVALSLSLVATWLVGRSNSRAMPLLKLAIVLLAFAVPIDLLALANRSGNEREIYVAAVRSSPFWWIGDFASTRATDRAAGASQWRLPGIRPLRRLSAPATASHRSWHSAPRLFSEPQVVIVLMLDGWRFQSFSAEDTRELWQLVAARGEMLTSHYTSYVGTDRSVYSLFYERHPFFASQDLRIRPREAPLIQSLRRHRYSFHAFQTDPHSYRFLADIYKGFQSVTLGPGDAASPTNDAAMLSAMEQLVRERDPAERLFVFALLHSTHYPFNAERLGSPIVNYTRAVRSLDGLVSTFLKKVAALDLSWLAIVTADHGTELGECMRFGYTLANARTLHVPLVILGSEDAQALRERARRLSHRLTTHQDLGTIIFGPDAALEEQRLSRSEMNVAMQGGAFGVDAPLVVHDSNLRAARVQLGDGTVSAACFSLESCLAAEEEVPCDAETRQKLSMSLCRFQGVECGSMAVR